MGIVCSHRFLSRFQFKLLFLVFCLSSCLTSQLFAQAFTWNNVLGGNWNLATNWSPNGVPSGAGDSASIVLLGSYPVALNQNITLDQFLLNNSGTTFTASGRTFTVNGPLDLDAGSVSWISSAFAGSGTLTNNLTNVTFQGNSTISIASVVQNGTFHVLADGLGATLTIADGDGFTNHGLIRLESQTNNLSRLNISSGSMTNSGSGIVTVLPGGSRTIGGAFENNGTFNINGTTALSKGSADYINNNAFNIATDATLTMSLSSEEFFQEAGVLDIQGAFNISGGKFHFDGGTISGPNEPVLSAGTLVIEPNSTGVGEVTLSSTSTLLGDIKANQTMNVRANGVTATATSAASFTNDGVINITADTTNLSRLNVTTGSMTNNNTVNIEPGAGGTRTIGTAFINHGDMNFNYDTALSKGSADYINHANIHIAPATSVTVALSSEEVFQEDGLFDNQGEFSLSAAKFHFNGGEFAGNPIKLSGATLNIGPGSQGTGVFEMRSSCLYSGDLDPNQTIDVIADGVTGTMTAANGFTNGGTINVTSDTSNSSRLFVTADPLVNTGTINFEPGAGGARTFAANLTNQGEFNVNTDTALSKGSSDYINQGQFNIKPLTTLTMTISSEEFFQDAGVLSNSGQYNISGGKFYFNGGDITGNPINLTGATLNIGPGSKGFGKFNLKSTCVYSGDVDPNQTINVQADGTTATLSAANGFINDGTINVTSATANTSRILVTADPLVNAGTINFEPGAGGARTFGANLINQGEFNVNTTTGLSKGSSDYINQGNFNIASDATLTMTISSEEFFQEDGILDVDGAFTISGGRFHFNGGEITGPNEPVLTSANLEIDPNSTGIGNVTTQGTSNIIGDIKTNQEVTIRGSGTTATLNTSGAFSNDGILNFTSLTSHTSRLVVSSSETFTNHGTVNVLPGAGGSRTMTVNLDNRGDIIVNKDTLIGTTNRNHVNSGEIKITSPIASATFSGSSFVNAIEGTISGVGTLGVASLTTFNNYGTIAPGLSPGILTINDDYNHQGTLDIDIHDPNLGTGYDQLFVFGDVLLNGTLRVAVHDNFIPSPSDQFVIMDPTGSVTGQFSGGFVVAGVKVSTFGGTTSGSFDIVYTPSSVILTNFQLISVGCGISGTQYLESDFDKDCFVDIDDYIEFTENWLQFNCHKTPNYCNGTDQNEDTVVDLLDFSLFNEQWMMCTEIGNPSCI